MNAIEVQGLRKEFGSTVAVEALNLEVRKGELFGLVGPDGANQDPPGYTYTPDHDPLPPLHAYHVWARHTLRRDFGDAGGARLRPQPDRPEVSRASFTSEYFVPVAEADSQSELTELLDKGGARIGLVVPARFGQKTALREKVAVQSLVDGTGNNTASIALGYFTAIAQTYSLEIILDHLRHIRYLPPFDVPALRAESRVWHNPDLKSNHFIVPGLIALIVMMVGAIMTLSTIVQEKESGSIEQLIVSPVHPMGLVIGKLVPYILFAMFDMLLVIWPARYSAFRSAEASNSFSAWPCCTSSLSSGWVL